MLTKLEQALLYKDNSKIKKLIRQGYDISNINLNAVFHLNTDIIILLIEHNYKNINIENNENWTPLFLAIQKGNIKIIEELLKYGANINYEVNLKPLIGVYTPLKYALLQKDWNIIELLIKKGADVKEYNYIGWNALKMAILNDDKEVYKLLHS
ncbi:MAG: ankyrin repeat domain-containing protein [Sulfurovum sp.]|nr:ankyrin repeat domain-containing protein [Sulfurovum sp.]